MPTGYVQRWKGKSAFAVGGISIGGVSLTGTGADFNTISGAGVSSSPSANSTMAGSGASNIISATAASVYTLSAPVPGAEKTLAITSVSSGVKIKAATNTSFGVSPAGSTITVIGSTIPMNIALEGISTSQWQIVGVFNWSTSVFPVPTLSTTT